jgi:hypothetical protein
MLGVQMRVIRPRPPEFSASLLGGVPESLSRDKDATGASPLHVGRVRLRS